MWINVNSFSGSLISLLSILSSHLSPLQLSVSHPPFCFIPLSLSLTQSFHAGFKETLVCCSFVVGTLVGEAAKINRQIGVKVT